jgi:NAD(P)-dependent dehydrogenase (short-subunit alcohol dehydrogenase family)
LKLIVIGAEGMVGSAACNELAARHEIIKVGRTSGDIQVDIEDRDSIDAMYRETGKVDAVISAVGSVHFAPLTSGVLDRDPVRQGTGAATANGALGGFVVGAAVEMPRGIRINVVSPGLLQASEKKYEGYFPGHEPVSSERVGLAYAKSVEGAITGQVIIIE